ANDLVWSTSLGRLLASCATNQPNWAGALLSIDPETLTVQHLSQLGAVAGRLAISSEAHLLYAGADYGVCVVSLPNLAMTNRFLLNPAEPRAFAFDLKPVPGSDHSILIASKDYNDYGFALGIYDDGIQRTNTQSFFSSGSSLAFGDDPALFYCQD